MMILFILVLMIMFGGMVFAPRAATEDILSTIEKTINTIQLEADRLTAAIDEARKKEEDQKYQKAREYMDVHETHPWQLRIYVDKDLMEFNRQLEKSMKQEMLNEQKAQEMINEDRKVRQDTPPVPGAVSDSPHSNSTICTAPSYVVAYLLTGGTGIGAAAMGGGCLILSVLDSQLEVTK